MADILKEIIKVLPDDKISDAAYEAANIVLYTKDKDYFLDNKGTIREAVKQFKKRIELRPDPSMCMEMEKAEKLIPFSHQYSQIKQQDFLSHQQTEGLVELHWMLEEFKVSLFAPELGTAFSISEKRLEKFLEKLNFIRF